MTKQKYQPSTMVDTIRSGAVNRMQPTSAKEFNLKKYDDDSYTAAYILLFYPFNIISPSFCVQLIKKYL